jgi:hypothetical protein
LVPSSVGFAHKTSAADDNQAKAEFVESIQHSCSLDIDDGDRIPWIPTAARSDRNQDSKHTEDEMVASNGVSAMVIAALAVMVLSCARTTQKETQVGGDDIEQQAADSDSERLEPASGTLPVVDGCTEATGDYVKCSSHDECCAGYSCGFDPDGSRVQRVCLPE